jgi:hypothetical protein
LSFFGFGRVSGPVGSVWLAAQRLRGSAALAVVASLTACLSFLSAPAAATSISVTALGQASTGLPITLPPGISGMTPQLGLQYSEGGINGPLGVGWSLQGISMVTRCPSTRPVDGRSAAVEFNERDRLCLDGQRLIRTNSQGQPVSPTQAGDAGGTALEFRTEKDTYSRIRVYPRPGLNISDGPGLIKVWTKSGLVYEYGAPADVPQSLWEAAVIRAEVTIYSGPVASIRRPVAVWPVRRVYDSSGNYMEFRFSQRRIAAGSQLGTAPTPGTEWNLAEIYYTGNLPKGQEPRNRVVFEYSDRSDLPSSGLDRSETYQWNHKNVSVQRLDRITAYVNWPFPSAGQANGAPPTSALPVRRYQLTYEQSPDTGRSRLRFVKECAGPELSSCMPATEFRYRGAAVAGAGFVRNTVFGGSDLATQSLHDVGGDYGVLVGDFNGDGRSDLLRWSVIAAETELWLSNGDGSFARDGSHSWTKPLFSGRLVNGGNPSPSGGRCVQTIAQDFNGDGRTDLIRITKSFPDARCDAEGAPAVYLSRASGGFDETPLLIGGTTTSPELWDSYAREFTDNECSVPQRGLFPPPEVGLPPVMAALVDRYVPSQPPIQGGLAPAPVAQPILGVCLHWNRTEGRRVHFLDLNADGLTDILITKAPPYRYPDGQQSPSDDSLCEVIAGGCTRVLLASVDGSGRLSFDDASMGLSVRFRSLYSDFAGVGKYPAFRRPDLADRDGDGLLDVISRFNGAWRSLGNGDFASEPAFAISPTCISPIDFNGDQREDCLQPSSNASAQMLMLSFGAATSAPVQQFNVTGAADSLLEYADGLRETARQRIGHFVIDVNGDGRQDIVRWGQSGSDHGVYLSRGDGSFSSRLSHGLSALGRPMFADDGSTTTVMGDFLGNGLPQFLHLKDDPSGSDLPASANQLYVLSVAAGPLDVLNEVVSPLGMRSRVESRVALPLAGDRYSRTDNSELAPSLISATRPLVDAAFPLYLITATSQDTPVGPKATEYFYAGLKAERGGRGLLGFSQTTQRTASPADAGGWLVNQSRYLLRFPYTGTVYESRALLERPGFAPVELSRTTNLYCDQVAAEQQNTSSPIAPCHGASLVKRPFLRSSQESGQDISGVAMPTVTTRNEVNEFGDLLRVEVDTSATVADVSTLYRKTTSNQFCAPGSSSPGGQACPNRTDGDFWILGRLVHSEVQASVSNGAALEGMALSAGSSPTASQTTGTLSIDSVPQANVQLSQATLAFGNRTMNQAHQLTVQVSNTGTAPLQGIQARIAEGSPPYTVANGCTTVAVGGAPCVITVTFTPQSVGSFNGRLEVTATGAANSPASVTLTGSATLPPQGTIAVDRSTLPFADTQRGSNRQLQVQLRNSGVANLEGVQVSVISGAADYAQSNNCPALLTPTSPPCVITVTFQPTADAQRPGILQITGSNATNSPVQIALSGNGRSPSAEIAPVPVTFGEVMAGRTGLRPITVRNTGVGPLTLGSPTFSNPVFSVADPGTCASLSIPTPGGTCTATLSFTPTSAAPFNATFTLPVVNGASAVATLTGTGVVRPEISLPASLTAFANTQVREDSAPQTFQVTNPGNANLVISSVQMAGSFPGDYKLTHNCSTVLPNGSACTINVTFSPQAEGSRPAVVRVLSNAGTGMNNVAVTGFGVLPNWDLQPTSLQFLRQLLGVQSAPRPVTLRNLGIGPVTVTGADFQPASQINFQVTPNCGTLVVQPLGPCSANITFTPYQIARVSAVFVVTDQLSRQRTVLLEGSGEGDFVSAPVVGGSAQGRLHSVGFRMIDGAMELTLLNAGQGTITGLSAQCTVAGGTVLIPPASTLAPGATTTVRVRGAGVSPCGLQVTGQNTSNSPWILGGY